MESLLKVDRLDGYFIGTESYQSSRCCEPTQCFVLHQREASGSISLKEEGRKPRATAISPAPIRLRWLTGK
jgi:hypothetical protein